MRHPLDPDRSDPVICALERVGKRRLLLERRRWSFGFLLAFFF